MNFRDVEDYLDGLANFEHTADMTQAAMGLDRVRQALAAIGEPQSKLKCIHVAGTKGKGSTCAFLFAMLKEAHYKVGLFTSPHLIRSRERIKVSFVDELGEIRERMIEEQEMCWVVTELKPVFDTVPGITFFEAFTIIALKFFFNTGMDVVILETGVGGRLDATNVVNPLVSVLTPISYDHTQLLGDSLAMIAAEKAEIIKENGFAVVAPQSPEVMAVIRDVAQRKNVRLYEVAKDFICDVIGSDITGSVFDFRGPFERYENLRIPLLGAHQIINCAVAIGVIEVLRLHDIVISLLAIKRGLAKTRWPGRFQIMRTYPYLILDGAQNGASAQALQSALSQFFPAARPILILGVCRDKDVAAICEHILPNKQLIILTQADHRRAMSVDTLQQRLPAVMRDSDSVHKTTRLIDALRLAVKQAGRDDVIVITGSLYLVAEAFTALQTVIFPDYDQPERDQNQ